MNRKKKINLIRNVRTFLQINVFIIIVPSMFLTTFFYYLKIIEITFDQLGNVMIFLVLLGGFLACTVDILNYLVNRIAAKPYIIHIIEKLKNEV